MQTEAPPFWRVPQPRRRPRRVAFRVLLRARFGRFGLSLRRFGFALLPLGVLHRLRRGWLRIVLACLPCNVVMASAGTPLVREQLDWAHETLAGRGFDVTTACVAGEPEAALNGYAREHGLDLLVIGAYGHSRIRHLVVGSTTTTLLRTSPVPVLVLR